MTSGALACVVFVLLTTSGGLESPRSLSASSSSTQVDKANPISGDWNAMFEVEGMKGPFRLKLRAVTWTVQHRRG